MDFVAFNGIFWNKYLPINKEWASPVVSKCACSTLTASALAYGKGTHQPLSNKEWSFSKTKYIPLQDIRAKKWKTFAVVRDPLKRLQSAYNTTKGYMCLAPEEWVKQLVQDMKEHGTDNIDRHVASQFAQYNQQDIDTFVRIEDLDEFLKEIGVEQVRRNTSKKHIAINIEDLDGILDEDYRIYNEIINGDKIYKPTKL